MSIDSNELLFLDAIHSGIIIVDEELTVYFWNRWLEARTNIQKEEIIEENLLDYFHYIDEEQLRRKIKFVTNFKSQSFYSVNPHRFLIDIKLNNITNKVFDLMQQNVSLSPFKYKDRDYIIIEIHDVTELEATNLKLNKEKKEKELLLNKVNTQQEMLLSQTKHAAMGEMISMIAHQWRQPITVLNSIYTRINVLRTLDELTDEEFNKAHKKSTEIIEHLSSTINDFRNYFHKDDDGIQKLLIPYLISKSISLFDSEFRNNNITLIEEYDENSKNMEINLPILKFTQVLLNFIKNSFDELQKKDIKNKFIKITSKIENGYLTIFIEDNAGGIPEDIIDKIFEPYFSTKGLNGTGLGLYMSKMIIEDHMSGELFVENSQNGALFTIKISHEAFL